jgi:hypothetical protein
VTLQTFIVLITESASVPLKTDAIFSINQLQAHSAQQQQMLAFRYDLVLMVVSAWRVLHLHGQADSC